MARPLFTRTVASLALASTLLSGCPEAFDEVDNPATRLDASVKLDGGADAGVDGTDASGIDAR